MSKKYLMFDLDDERIIDLADVLSNKTSKKILDYLADKEANETEISRDLSMPANTVNYNVKKLLKAGLIEKSKSFLWSVKGKRIVSYKIANKKIIISPTSFRGLKQFLLTFGLTVLIALGIRNYYSNAVVEETAFKAMDAGSGEAAGAVVPVLTQEISNTGAIAAVGLQLWIWFLLGAVSALVIYAIVSRFSKN